jgi:hypothetical protein
MATIWPPSTMRLTSSAGRQDASPSRITKTPAGFAVSPNPPPPLPSVSFPPPPPPRTFAAGRKREPSRSIASPNTWFGFIPSMVWSMVFCSTFVIARILNGVGR